MMQTRTRVFDLLRRSAELYDAPNSPLPSAAASSLFGGFKAGGDWMRLVFDCLRSESSMLREQHFQRMAWIKYGLASFAALLIVAAAYLNSSAWMLPFSVIAFYAVEVQMVFLFPLAIDGSTHPFRDARLWTVRAGGTFAAMLVVIPLACVMLFGGFFRRGFLRCWCLGCLSVCLWYEDLRTLPPSDGVSGLSLKVGASGPLLVRTEHVHLGLSQPFRLLYASDLHLGHRWTRSVPEQLLQAALQSKPELIVLGGDLADNAKGLPELQQCVAALRKLTPVFAVPGNHDERTGLSQIRASVEAAGGSWLPDSPIETPVHIDGKPAQGPFQQPRILCIHDPAEFPNAVSANYRLVLSGHLHGGQCVFAEQNGRLLPAAWIYRWHGLRFAESNSIMIVSRGVADTFPLRFNCPREVILCNIT